MSRLFNEKIFNTVFKILMLAAAAKLIALLIFILLPKSGLQSVHKDSGFVDFNVYGSITPFSSTAKNNINSQSFQISNLKLLAVYKESNGGFAVIHDGILSQIVKTGDSYKQYSVDEIKQDGIYLLENGRRSWVGFAKSNLEVSSPQSQDFILSHNIVDNIGMVRGRQGRILNNQTNDTEHTNMISRNEIQSLMENPDDMLKNIGFKEVMKDGKIDGFRILSINRNSPLAKLGLRAGDVVHSFNGVRLDSYSSALGIYSNINSISKVKLEIVRNNEKKELEYEIY